MVVSSVLYWSGFVDILMYCQFVGSDHQYHTNFGCHSSYLMSPSVLSVHEANNYPFVLFCYFWSSILQRNGLSVAICAAVHNVLHWQGWKKSLLSSPCSKVLVDVVWGPSASACDVKEDISNIYQGLREWVWLGRQQPVDFEDLRAHQSRMCP